MTFPREIGGGFGQFSGTFQGKQAPVAGNGFDDVLNAVSWQGVWSATEQTEGDGNPVTTFVDQSGNGNNWTEGVPGVVTLRTAGLNGQPALEFDGQARFTGGVSGVTQDWGWMILCEPSTFDGTFLGASTNNPAIRKTATVDFEWRGNGGAFIRTVKASASAGAHLVMGETDGSLGHTKIWFDGALIIDEAGDADYTGFAINALGGISSAEIKGMFAMAGLVFNTLWTNESAARATIEDYAKNVYGAPIP